MESDQGHQDPVRPDPSFNPSFVAMSLGLAPKLQTFRSFGVHPCRHLRIQYCRNSEAIDPVPRMNRETPGFSLTLSISSARQRRWRMAGRPNPTRTTCPPGACLSLASRISSLVLKNHLAGVRLFLAAVVLPACPSSRGAPAVRNLGLLWMGGVPGLGSMSSGIPSGEGRCRNSMLM